jgi:hypothetical protein
MRDKIKESHQIIADACLKHNYSGLSSVDAQARLILSTLEEEGYVVIDKEKLKLIIEHSASQHQIQYDSGRLALQNHIEEKFNLTL